MNDRIIEFDPLIEGVLIKRYKRFLADIKLASGDIVTAHCANTGPMKGLLSEGAKVRISVSHSPKENYLLLGNRYVSLIQKMRRFG